MDKQKNKSMKLLLPKDYIYLVVIFLMTFIFGFDNVLLQFKNSTGDLNLVSDLVEIKNNSFYTDIFLKTLNEKDMFNNLLINIDDEYIYNLYSAFYEIFFGINMSNA